MVMLTRVRAWLAVYERLIEVVFIITLLILGGGVGGWALSRAEYIQQLAVLETSRLEESRAVTDRLDELIGRLEAVAEKAEEAANKANQAAENSETASKQSGAAVRTSRAAARAAARQADISDQQRAALNRAIEDANKALVK